LYLPYKQIRQHVHHSSKIVIIYLLTSAICFILCGIFFQAGAFLSSLKKHVQWETTFTPLF
jgi:hypothetical protein